MSALVTYLAIILGIPLAITLATPARYLGFYLLWLGMLGVLAVLWPGGSDHSSPFSGIGEAIEAFILGAWVSFVVLKIAFVQGRRQFESPSAKETEAEAEEPDGFSLLLAGLTGLFVAPWAMFVIALAFAEGTSALLTHGAPLILLITAVALLLRYAKSTNPLLQTFAGAMTGSGAITSVMTAIYLTSRITAVVDHAEAAAGGSPYCIQIYTAHAGYRPAITRLDFSPLMMRARCDHGWCFANHGILAIDGNAARRLMHWSYGHADFRDDALNAGTYLGPPIVCKPARGFARDLPLFWKTGGVP